MNLINRIAQAFRGARRIEALIVIALAAVVGLIFIGGSGDEAGGAQTALEERMAEALSKIEGAGKVNVIISEDMDGNPAGVLVVAEGAGDMSVYMRLLGAVKALVDVDASRIEIIRMESG